jgi:hypothetical protein
MFSIHSESSIQWDFCTVLSIHSYISFIQVLLKIAPIHIQPFKGRYFGWPFAFSHSALSGNDVNIHSFILIPFIQPIYQHIFYLEGEGGRK